MKATREIVNLFLLTAAVAVGVALTGCDRDETLIDVDTPRGGVEVQRDRDDGDITVDVDR